MLYNENYINNEIKNSQKGYDSTMAPFFRQYEDDNIDEIESNSIIPDNNITNIEIIDKYLNICDNKDIQDFYINNNGVDREIYINNWTFFSLEKIMSLDEAYKKHNINNIIDLGYTYHGMGWIVVVFYYIENKKLYFRMDGGSNNYDRIENFNRLKNIDNYVLNISDTGLIFKDFLNKVENNFHIPDSNIF